MPATYITTADAKAHCRIYHSDDDAYVATLVEAAVSEWESLTRVPITQLAVTMIVYEAPADGYIHPDQGPISPSLSGQTVQYTNDAGASVTTTLASTDWEVRGGWAVLPVDSDWRYPLTLTYKPGLVSTSTPPSWLKQALLFRIAEMYHYRGDDVQSPESKAFLAIARRHGLGQLA